MATTTPNFGWSVPTSSDLVKNGATAIETLGDSIDASLVDLKGGTTGQVLAKATNTDMDFTWTTSSAGMTNPMTTTGDTIYSSSGSTPARLGIGSSGQVLTVAGGVPTWATPAAGGGGKVLQVVSGTYTTATTVATSTYTDTGLSLAITPTLSTSKILVIVSQVYGLARSGADQGHGLKIIRGATEIYSTGGIASAMYVNAGGGVIEANAFTSLTYLDSPSTTSSTTYKMQGAVLYTSGSVVYQTGSSRSTITLMEIGA